MKGSAGLVSGVLGFVLGRLVLGIYEGIEACSVGPQGL